MEKIESVQNPKIKLLADLQAKSRERRSSGLFVVEGVREILHCISSGYKVKSLFVCPEITGDAGIKKLEGIRDEGTIFEVSARVYDKIAYRGGTEGMIAEFAAKNFTLDDLGNLIDGKKENPLVIVLESVEKPGNLGAVLRSADAAGADAVIICNPLTDLFNPNLIRASIGAVFTVPTVCCTTAEAICWLKRRNYGILTAQLQDSDLYYDSDMTGSTAIVMGTESTGLGQEWREAATSHIRIPMLGRLDSLNVSVSAAILLFEAIRQRQSTQLHKNG